MFDVLTSEEERIGKAIVNAAYEVHKHLGPELLEKVYEVCFCHVLAREGFNVKRQLEIPIVFKSSRISKFGLGSSIIKSFKIN